MFEYTDILECAHWAQMAYSTIPDAGCITDAETGCVCYVVKLDLLGIAFVVFRGTSSIVDAMADCNVRMMRLCAEPAEPARVHGGFLDQCLSVYKKVKGALDGFDGEVRVTGHSLVRSVNLSGSMGLQSTFD